MNEKMQMLFAHLACVAMIATCFWLSVTVLKDQPQLGHIVIGMGLFLWGKIGFKPSAAVVDMILETLTPKQVNRVVKTMHPPPALPPVAAVIAVTAPPVQWSTCLRCGAALSPTSNHPLCEACSAPPSAA